MIFVTLSTDSCGEEVFDDMMLSINVVVLNAGRAKFLRRRVNDSILNVAFASPESCSQVSWRPELDL